MTAVSAVEHLRRARLAGRKVKTTRARLDGAVEERDMRIRAAVKAGVSQRAVAVAAGLSHVAVGKIVNR